MADTFNPLSADEVPAKRSPRGRLPSGAPNPVDVHIGKRLRLRRMMLGLSQEQLAAAIGVAFQQIQKYEFAINRVNTARLWDLAKALGCTVSFFYREMGENTAACSPRHLALGPVPSLDDVPDAISSRPETLKLVRAYTTIRRPETRRCVLDLVDAVGTQKSERLASPE